MFLTVKIMLYLSCKSHLFKKDAWKAYNSVFKHTSQCSLKAMPLAPAMHFVPYWCERSPAINPSFTGLWLVDTWTLQGWGYRISEKVTVEGGISGHVHPTHTKRARLARFSFQTSKLELLFCARGEEYQLNIKRCWTLNCYVRLPEVKIYLEKLQRPRQGSKLRCFCLSGSARLIDFAFHFHHSKNHITCASNTSQHPFVNSLAFSFSTTSKSTRKPMMREKTTRLNESGHCCQGFLPKVPAKTVTMGFHPEKTQGWRSLAAEPTTRSLIQGHSIIASSHRSDCPNGFEVSKSRTWTMKSWSLFSFFCGGVLGWGGFFGRKKKCHSCDATWQKSWQILERNIKKPKL